MLEKLRMIEEIARDFNELTEFKKALLAYEMGIRSDEITINQYDAIDDAIADYYSSMKCLRKAAYSATTNRYKTVLWIAVIWKENVVLPFSQKIPPRTTTG